MCSQKVYVSFVLDYFASTCFLFLSLFCLVPLHFSRTQKEKLLWVLFTLGFSFVKEKFWQSKSSKEPLKTTPKWKIGNATENQFTPEAGDCS